MGGLSLSHCTFRRPMAAFVFCFPHPDRASSTVCSKQKTRSGCCGCNDETCGGEGIRTLDRISPIHTFQACQFNHSCTPPNLLIGLHSHRPGTKLSRGLPIKGGKNTISELSSRIFFEHFW